LRANPSLSRDMLRFWKQEAQRGLLHLDGEDKKGRMEQSWGAALEMQGSVPHMP
jgi:hypothetical protein